MVNEIFFISSGKSYCDFLLEDVSLYLNDLHITSKSLTKSNYFFWKFFLLPNQHSKAKKLLPYLLNQSAYPATNSIR